MASSKSVVLAALFANAAIAVLKFVGFLLTASPAMLSETYHSISDTGNQVFLLIGIRYGAREPDRKHPFGYGKAQFFYSFLVSVLLFGIAGWESAKHGYDALTSHGGHEGAREVVTFLGVTINTASFPFEPWMVNYGVLIGAFVFEGYALLKARQAIHLQMEDHGWDGYREAFTKTSDVTTLTALTEDTVAVVGIGLALVGLTLKQLTGNAIYDAAAALLIGVLLMSFAVALAWENKRLLLGESLPEAEEARLRQIAANWEGVEEIIEFRTVYFGPNRLIVTADIAFDPDLDTETIDTAITGIEDALHAEDESVEKVYIEPEA